MLGCGRFRRVAVVTATASWVYPVFLLALVSTVGLTVLAAALAWTAAESLRALAYLSQALRDAAPGRPSGRLLREAVHFGIRAWVGSLAALPELPRRPAPARDPGLRSRARHLRRRRQRVGGAALPAGGDRDGAAAARRPGRRGAPCRPGTARLPRRGPRHGGAALVAAVVGPVLLPLAFGAPFEASVTPFLLLLPGALGFAAIAVFSNALMAASAPGLSSFGAIVALVVGVTLDLVLIPSYGASGAAGASSAAFLAGGGVALLVFRRRAPFAWAALLRPRREDLGMFRALARPLGADRSS